MIQLFHLQKVQLIESIYIYILYHIYRLTNLSSDTSVDINEVIISSAQQAKRRLKEHVGMRKNTTGHPVPLDVLQRINSNFQRQNNNISEDDSSDTIVYSYYYYLLIYLEFIFIWK